MASKCPAREDIGHDQPLRLAVAAALAFPDGLMTASGLRREAALGRRPRAMTWPGGLPRPNVAAGRRSHASR